MWPPTRDMGGVLTLSGAPSVEQYNYCGFSFCVPFSSRAIRHLLPAGVKVIPTSGNPGSSRWTDETNVAAYFIGDELTQGSKCSGHKCTPEEIKAFYDALKKKTNKPVGSIWVAFPPDSYYGVISQLDFAMIVCYPYKSRYDDAWALGRMRSLRERIADRVRVPVIIIGQAEDASSRLRAPGIEGVRIQHDYWYDAGFPVCWYSWGSNGTEDIARNFQALMHEWYTGLPPEEIITDETTIHTCNVKISYQLSSFAENNDLLSCPNCGMGLGVEGIRGSEEIIETITTETITCSKCGSQLELKVSSIAEKNTEQFCPVCGEPAD